jgi:hypothetical protein
VLCCSSTTALECGSTSVGGPGLTLTASAAAGAIATGALTGSGTLSISSTTGTIDVGTVDLSSTLTLSVSGTGVAVTLGNVGGTTRPLQIVFMSVSSGSMTLTNPAPANFLLVANSGELIVSGVTVNPSTALTVPRIDVRDGGVLALAANMDLTANGNAPACRSSAGVGSLTLSYVFVCRRVFACLPRLFPPSDW